MPATSVDLLRSVPLFGGMTDTAVEAIRQLVETADFDAGVFAGQSRRERSVRRLAFDVASYRVIAFGDATGEHEGH